MGTSKVKKKKKKKKKKYKNPVIFDKKLKTLMIRSKVLGGEKVRVPFKSVSDLVEGKSPANSLDLVSKEIVEKIKGSAKDKDFIKTVEEIPLKYLLRREMY